jgi:hypothetical protein
MGRADVAPTIVVTVACSPRPGTVEETALRLPADATVLDALEAGGLLARDSELELEGLAVGVWGRLRPLDAALRDGDRVEIYRPLQVDPKEARRLRQRKQQATCNPRR